VVVLEKDDQSHVLAEGGGAFDFLLREPEIYSDEDILPERRNPEFRGAH
jgi:hypothetical protein